ncbi:hypothetical protein CUR178_03256 [Leishmania enriettii]|uniref:Uncharacterized protein n=1 Tax=Leishmania enriettii TaxID=5663 RepID=A0A836H947_LEIEN|nr:hypothetical protein CUR178_03256 [Leishmania enriettii]
MSTLRFSASIAPQAQASNYPTAHNISFRPSSLSTPSTRRNTKLKCPSCGVWGEKGTVCKVCRSAIPGPRPIYALPSSGTSKRPTTGSVCRFAGLPTSTQTRVAASSGTASTRDRLIKHEAPQTTAAALHLRACRSRASAPPLTATQPTSGTPLSAPAKEQSSNLVV